MPRVKSGGNFPSFGIDYSAPEIQEAAANFGYETLSHLPDEIRERIDYLRDEGYETLADELYDQYMEE